jgi:hypothetical protein
MYFTHADGQCWQAITCRLNSMWGNHTQNVKTEAQNKATKMCKIKVAEKLSVPILKKYLKILTEEITLNSFLKFTLTKK